MARVRLRPRSPRAPGPGWLRGEPATSWTTVGSLDSPHRAVVDPAGLVAVAGRSWSLDWWIGAEDRWHVPAREVAVRQSLVGSSPVVETRVRVPSGDAVQRVYVARTARGDDVLVVEVTNDSTVPFALALAIRPYDLSGRGRVDRIELDGPVVRVDGSPVLVLPRSPGRMALATAATGDAAEPVLDGAAEPVRSAGVKCRNGLANGAFVFPLAHTAVLRVLVPLAPGDLPDADGVPTADQVASGWQAHAARGARVEVPNRMLREAVAASTRHLLLAQDGPTTAAALDLMGFAAEAASILDAASVGAPPDEPGAALQAVTRHWLLTRDPAAAGRAARWVASLVGAIPRAEGDDRALGRAALPAAADLLDAAGEPTAAEDVRAVAEVAVAPPPPPDLEALLRAASPTWTWPSASRGQDLGANAALLGAVRQLLVEEVPGGLALCPDVPAAWLGQGWEVHGLPTACGVLSYAIRWHGERPALLWEIEPHPGLPPARLTAPGLDDAWSSTDPSGEALLAVVPVPPRPRERRGLTIPVTIEPMPGGRR